MNKRIIVGITGASGSIYAVRLLRILTETCYEVHLVITDSAKITLGHEQGQDAIDNLRQLCSFYHDVHNVGAVIASGSFEVEGMIIVPCSINTMSEIACSLASNLLTRSADVMLKEKRKLILMIRETPLHLGHLRNMSTLSEIGAVIAPPIPSFYNLPTTIDDLVDHSIRKVLNLFDIKGSKDISWKGI
ncbi:UbiX family flavin prenyltransferase [Neoehrlichia mikurensis]|uniref:Flavin prenyltransferase UbiX n=1 Tax=Neoehrlichia mikurensis TaxID=89586 RepID=A0A9Q9BUR4_9RICK|nr:UbiX family flavin prenyltransferase [Neoehrlichia mikurensis]QXK91903.1 UbiX family flavin prenyltransferase [Neoehrlichia mikurensis]QXK93116.1 UbiX family flavin prenyltransferase [Neoehrlichia mikurensis]QXK93596.1 UbiX family flavin prenyltransferase [Neoehrlichia mikurensis]UTO55451.1 UbiX family flavin prenyltransferase [Neoehrlichia mikurensis]UTO56371.1 UbiX family flavin prenyltransferase [Neoehrlichia mikurensis]